MLCCAAMARALFCMYCSFHAQLITFNMQPKWFFNKSFYSQKCLLSSACNFALFSRITSPLALTLQQIFLRQIATNTHLPLPSQKLYHIFIITPHLAHPLCKKYLAIGSQKSILLAPLCQSHASAKLNTPSPSFNPTPLSKTHHSPSAEYVAVAIQTKYIYYSTAALAYYPHMR